MSNKKAKEFWIQASKADPTILHEVWASPNLPSRFILQIHVIEKSAYDELMEDVRVLRNSLDEASNITLKAIANFDKKYGDKK